MIVPPVKQYILSMYYTTQIESYKPYHWFPYGNYTWRRSLSFENNNLYMYDFFSNTEEFKRKQADYL